MTHTVVERRLAYFMTVFFPSICLLTRRCRSALARTGSLHPEDSIPAPLWRCTKSFSRFCVIRCQWLLEKVIASLLFFFFFYGKVWNGSRLFWLRLPTAFVSKGVKGTRVLGKLCVFTPCRSLNGPAVSLESLNLFSRSRLQSSTCPTSSVYSSSKIWIWFVNFRAFVRCFETLCFEVRSEHWRFVGKFWTRGRGLHGAVIRTRKVHFCVRGVVGSDKARKLSRPRWVVPALRPRCISRNDVADPWEKPLLLAGKASRLSVTRGGPGRRSGGGRNTTILGE